MIEPDLDATEEHLYEIYKVWCDNNGVKANLKGYLQWVDERY